MEIASRSCHLPQPQVSSLQPIVDRERSIPPGPRGIDANRSEGAAESVERGAITMMQATGVPSSEIDVIRGELALLLGRLDVIGGIMQAGPPRFAPGLRLVPPAGPPPSESS